MDGINPWSEDDADAGVEDKRKSKTFTSEDDFAEGVESELQLSYLKVLNCDLVQGMLFGEPMKAADYFNLLLTESRGRASYRELFA